MLKNFKDGYYVFTRGRWAQGMDGGQERNFWDKKKLTARGGIIATEGIREHILRPQPRGQ
jgi:hypothetical protein